MKGGKEKYICFVGLLWQIEVFDGRKKRIKRMKCKKCPPQIQKKKQFPRGFVITLSLINDYVEWIDERNSLWVETKPMGDNTNGEKRQTQIIQQIVFTTIIAVYYSKICDSPRHRIDKLLNLLSVFLRITRQTTLWPFSRLPIKFKLLINTHTKGLSRLDLEWHFLLLLLVVVSANSNNICQWRLETRKHTHIPIQALRSIF